MTFLYGIKMKDSLPIYIALSRLYGIGIPSALLICQQLLIPSKIRLNQLSPLLLEKLNKHLSSLILENNLRRIQSNKKSNS